MNDLSPETLRERAAQMTETRSTSRPQGNTGKVQGVPSGVPAETGGLPGVLALGNTGTPGTPINNNSHNSPDVQPFEEMGNPTTHSESGVPGVPRVPSHAKSNEINQLKVNSGGTRAKTAGVAGVPADAGYVSFGGYTSNKKGLYFTPPDAEASPMELCGPLRVLAMTRDGAGEGWGLFLEWHDFDHQLHQVAVPREIIGKGGGEQLRSLLASHGLYVSSRKAQFGHLTEYLGRVQVEARRETVAVTGWHKGEYVTPNKVYSSTGTSSLVFQTANTATMAYNQAGTLDGWKQNVGRLAIGNSRLMLSFGAAFAAPLLRLLGIDGGGFHFRGPSSTGKTTLARGAASVYSDQAFSQTWRATSNGLEGVAAARNDALLILDEIGQVDPKDAGAVAYMLANGEGRTRAARDGSARPPVRFRVLFLSTGEISLADRVGEDRFSKARAMAGQEVRLLDVPADTGHHGAFENLHGFESGAALSDHIRAAVGANYGTAFGAFVTALIGKTPAELDALKQRVERRTREFLSNRDDGGQLQRAAERFAVACVAAEVAAEAGVGPWTVEDAKAGVAACFEAWVVARGGTGSSESKQALKNMQGFIEIHGSSRFEVIKPYETPSFSQTGGFDHELQPQRIVNQAGFHFRDGAESVYGFTAAGFAEAMQGLDKRQAAIDLAEAGYLEGPDNQGKYSISKKVHGTKYRLYLVKGSILEAE